MQGGALSANAPPSDKTKIDRYSLIEQSHDIILFNIAVTYTIVLNEYATTNRKDCLW